jgi:hypothetical protein
MGNSTPKRTASTKPAKPFRVGGKVVDRATHLWWKPVPKAKAYAIEWPTGGNRWATIGEVDGDGCTPDADGLVRYVDQSPGPAGPGGTYRVVAYFSEELQGSCVTSAPVRVRPAGFKPPSRAELLARLRRLRVPAPVAELIAPLKYGPRGYTAVLPKDAGTCLGQRIEVEVNGQDLNDATLAALAEIVGNLPKLAARAARAFEEEGGEAALDESDRLARPRIVLRATAGKPAPTPWSLIVEIKDSDFGWHIQFVGTRFKEIWAGG